MKIQNLQEFIINYKIKNHISASNFILSIILHFTHCEHKIENLQRSWDSDELLLTLPFKTIYINNFKDKEEIINKINNIFLNSKILVSLLNIYKFQSTHYKPIDYDIEDMIFISKYFDMNKLTEQHKIRIKTINISFNIKKLQEFKNLLKYNKDEDNEKKIESKEESESEEKKEEKLTIKQQTILKYINEIEKYKEIIHTNGGRRTQGDKYIENIDLFNIIKSHLYYLRQAYNKETVIWCDNNIDNYYYLYNSGGILKTIQI